MRAAARIDGWEVSWPIEDAPSAVDGLARSRKVVLSLDLLDVDADGQYVSTPWSVFEPDPDAPIHETVADARRAARDALAQAGPDHPWVLISWE